MMVAGVPIEMREMSLSLMVDLGAHVFGVGELRDVEHAGRRPAIWPP